MRPPSIQFPLALVLALATGVTAGCGEVKRPDGGAGLIQEHARAPQVSAPDQDGKTRTLAEFAGKPVVLYFYPKDGTPGCTKEACAFRDAWTKLQATGAAVVGVSMDDVDAHAKFVREHNLPFTLLSDADGKIGDAYGVKRNLGMESRVTFLIDAQGNVARVFPKVDPAIHVDEVLAAITALTPPGASTPAPSAAASVPPSAGPSVKP